MTKLCTSCQRPVIQHASIGKDSEGFVMSKTVGADAWRRTGVLTFDSSRTSGEKGYL